MPEDKLSFIPQKTFEPTFYKRKGPGIVILFSGLLFFLSLAAYGGLIFYKNNIKKEIDTLAQSLEKAKAGFDLPLINEVGGVSDKINYSQKLLEQHTSLVPIFDLLQKDTLRDIFFKDFKYSVLKNEGPVISMSGSAKDYTTLALQGDVFEKDKNIKSISFSNLGLGDKGVVNFTVNVVLDPSMIIYRLENEQ